MTKQWGLLFHPADDHQCLAKVALGVARRMGQGHEHLLRPAAMLPHVVLDDGVLAAEPMLVPESLEDPLGGVALLPGTPEVVYQDLVDDASEGLILSLSKGWAGGADSAAGSPAALSRPESSAPCPGADPNTRETSRMLIPSTITARRTRRYTSTWYIHPTTHKHDFEPMDGRGRYIFQPPQCQAVNPSRWSTLAPPFTPDVDRNQYQYQKKQRRLPAPRRLSRWRRQRRRRF